MIPSRAGSPWVAGAVEAVVAQGAGEVFVVSEHDAGHGTPVPAGPLAGFAARANAGLRAARIAGFRRAVLLNDDAVAMPGALDALVGALDGPDVAAAGAVLVRWDGTAIQQAGIRLHRPTGRIRGLTGDPGDAVVPCDAVSGAAMAVDLDRWSRLGGLDERFLFYLEDVDFCRRATDDGARVVVAGAARVRHHGGGTRPQGSTQAAWHLGRSHALLARTLGGGRARRVARVACVALLGLAWSARRVGGRGPGSFLSGLAEGLVA